MQCIRAAIVRYSVRPSPLALDGPDVPMEESITLAVEASVYRRLTTPDPTAGGWPHAAARALFDAGALEVSRIRRAIAPDRDLWQEWERRRREQERTRAEWHTAVTRLGSTVPRAKLSQLVRRYTSEEDRLLPRFGQQVEHMLDLPETTDALARTQEIIEQLAQWVDAATMVDIAEDFYRTSGRMAEDAQIMKDELRERYDALVAGAEHELRAHAAQGICMPESQCALLDDMLFLFDGQYGAEEMRMLMVEYMDDLRRRMIEAAAALDRTRDAALAERPNEIPERVRALVWRRDGGRCVVCQSVTDLEFDHVVPRSQGGASTVRNVQVLCGRCNERKGAQVARMGTFREKRRAAETLDLFPPVSAASSDDGGT